MIKKLLALAVLASMALSMAACNTTHGLGKDVEKAGDKIQDAAD